MKAAQWKTQRSKLLLFMGGCFFLPGLLMLLISLAPSLIDVQRMGNWPSVPGTLLSATLDTRRQDNNSNVFLAKASYHYTVDYQSYSNNRVAINDSYDNTGDFHRDLARELRNAMASGRTVPVYYNPAKPEQSILNRDFRIGIFLIKLVFATVFSVVGGALILIGWRGKQINTAADVENEPWTLNADWQGQTIYSNAKLGMIVTLIFALVWNLTIWLSMWFIGPELWEKQDPAGLLLIAFAVIALVLIIRSVQVGLRWRRFGRTPLVLNPFPGQLGGVVSGYVSLNHVLEPGSEVEVTVVVMRVRQGKKNSTNTPIWQRIRKASIELSANGCHLRFEVPIEKDLPPSDRDSAGVTDDKSNRRTRHYWQLRVKHTGSGLDRIFTIPVFDVAPDQLVQTNNNDSAFSFSEGLPGSANDHWFGLPDVQQPAPESALSPHIAPSTDTLQMHFPLSHGFGMSLILAFVGLVFFGAGVLVVVQMGGFFGWLFASVFLLIGALMSLAGIFDLLTSKTVLFDSRSVHVSTRFLGVLVRKRQIDYEQIQTFKPKRAGSSSTGGNEHRIYYKVYAQCTDTKKIDIANMVQGDEAANALSDYLNGLVKVS